MGPSFLTKEKKEIKQLIFASSFKKMDICFYFHVIIFSTFVSQLSPKLFSEFFSKKCYKMVVYEVLLIICQLKESVMHYQMEIGISNMSPNLAKQI